MPPLYPSPGPFPSHQALAAVDKARPMLGRLVAWSLGRLVAWSLGRLVVSERIRSARRTMRPRAAELYQGEKCQRRAACGQIRFHPFPQMLQEIRGENFLNVHCIGQRNTRRVGMEVAWVSSQALEVLAVDPQLRIEPRGFRIFSRVGSVGVLFVFALSGTAHHACGLPPHQDLRTLAAGGQQDQHGPGQVL